MEPSPAVEEVFLVQGEGDESLLYAPLRRTVVALNDGAVNSVRKFLSTEPVEVNESDNLVIDELRTAGLFVEPYPKLPTAPSDYGFRPHQVTIFPTTRCNLRCIYCYANAGLRSEDMPWEIAQAAIDFVVNNALAVGRKDFIVGFHGGGEPTVAWKLMRQATLYAHKLASENGLTVRIHSASNGVLSNTQRQFIVEHFTGMNLSIDGPPDIQDRQRPMINGKGSFARVAETVKFFQNAGFPFGIRVTLTEKSGDRLCDIVRFVREMCPTLNQLHVEPVWECGRCLTSGERPPDDSDFLRHFAEAYELAHDLGYSLFYSGARLDMITNQFCAAPGDGFSVTPEGLVTSCFEVANPSDPRAKLFHYGRYDFESKQFKFDEDKLARLRKLRVENIPYCSDCFCKWHCAGDCYAKALPDADPDKHEGSARCSLNRELTRLHLLRVANNYKSAKQLNLK